jgi:LysR family glycine cleavage system transcriptional activator
MSMALDAAADGQGVAMARTALAEWDLASGRLVRPFAAALKADFGYWIVCPKANADLPKITTFRGWLLAQAAKSPRAASPSKSSAQAKDSSA